jgi:16S rRNA (cytosine1402-N4)-methyltransferase
VPDASDPAVLHRSVLLAETVAHLAPASGMRVLDCTLGLGGHSAALLGLGAEVLGIDRDEHARAAAQRRLAAYAGRFTMRGGTFAAVAEELLAAGERYDAVLADLGVSSMQLDDESRGFSLRTPHAADMRMGDGCPDTALTLIDRLDEAGLADIIFRYGEERFSRRIARALKQARAAGRLESGEQLAATVRCVVPGRHQRHPALRTFQALRIAVNDELGQLGRLLTALPGLLRPGGRAVVISFHSLEDRLVKNAFRLGRAHGTYQDAARRVVTAGEQELAANPRAAAAKLRWAVAYGDPAAGSRP